MMPALVLTMAVGVPREGLTLTGYWLDTGKSTHYKAWIQGREPSQPGWDVGGTRECSDSGRLEATQGEKWVYTAPTVDGAFPPDKLAKPPDELKLTMVTVRDR